MNAHIQLGTIIFSPVYFRGRNHHLPHPKRYISSQMGHFDVAKCLLDARASVDTAAWRANQLLFLPSRKVVQNCVIPRQNGGISSIKYG